MPRPTLVDQLMCLHYLGLSEGKDANWKRRNTIQDVFLRLHGKCVVGPFEQEKMLFSFKVSPVRMMLLKLQNNRRLLCGLYRKKDRRYQHHFIQCKIGHHHNLFSFWLQYSIQTVTSFSIRRFCLLFAVFLYWHWGICTIIHSFFLLLSPKAFPFSSCSVEHLSTMTHTLRWDLHEKNRYKYSHAKQNKYRPCNTVFL